MGKGVKIEDAEGNVVGMAIPNSKPTISIGNAHQFVVTSVDVNYERGEFTKIRIEMIANNFGLIPLGQLDFSGLFKSPEVAKAVNDNIEKQARKFNFEEV